MRNLKRALSLALASIMVLGLMVVGASAASYNDFTDKDEIKNSEAVNTMVSLGVISGKGDGSSYDPTGSLTRAEACTLIARMLGGGKDPVLGSNIKSNFSDTQGHWAENYIAYCANLGIIAGVGDGSFNPDGALTGSAAAKMVLCALGYKPEFEGIGGSNWELATNTLATKVKLYDGLESLNPSATITRDDVAQLIYNGVQANEVEYRNLQGDYSGTLYAQPVNPNGNSTMLNVRFGVVKFTGIVEANDKISVADGGTDQHANDAVALEGQTLIHVTDVAGYSSATYGNLYNAQVLKVATSDDMVGQEVAVYVKFNNQLSPNAAASTVLGEPILTNNNTVVETNGRLKDADAVRAAVRAGGLSNVGGQGFTYTVAGRAEDDADADGNATTKADASLATCVTDDITSHTGDETRSAGIVQRFIDNDGDGITDYVIRTIPTLTSVSVVNSSSEKYTFAAPAVGTQVFADVVTEETLAKDDVVLMTQYSDGCYHVTKAQTVEGEVTAYNNNNNSVTIDGTAYVNGAGVCATTLNGIDWKLDNDMVGNSYVLYLDESGYVVGYKEVDTAIGNYAIVRGFSVTGSDSLGYTAKVKVLNEKGETATYDVNAANTAVNLDLAAEDATTEAKEDALFVATWFDPDNSNGTNLVNHLFSYSVDGSTITLAKPQEVNSRYTLVTNVDASQTLNKNKSSYTYDSTAKTIVADQNTVFFFKNSDGTFSVTTGLSSLPSTNLTMAASDGEAIYYTATVGGTKAAKAIFVTLTSDFTSSRSYAFVIGKATEGVVNGTPTYTYDVVLADGTVTTLTSKSDNAVKNQVWEYTADGADYVKFVTPSNRDVNARVDYLGDRTVSLVDAGTDAALDSYVLASDAKIYDVTDTDNVQTTTLSVNNVVATIRDNTDNTIKAVFIYDNILGDLATAIVPNADGTVTWAGLSTSALTDNTTMQAAESTETVILSYTSVVGAKVKITINGTTVHEDATAATSATTVTCDTYTLNHTGDLNGLEIVVTVSMDNKDTYTKTYNVASTYSLKLKNASPALTSCTVAGENKALSNTTDTWVKVGDKVVATLKNTDSDNASTGAKLSADTTPVTENTAKEGEDDAVASITFQMPTKAITITATASSD